jgi:glycosyltransferase involved in cell wall biosynthesis
MSGPHKANELLINSDNQPLVSIIIPIWNAADLIIETLASIFNQTYTSYEVIMIDDGSADNLTEVLKPYLEKIIYIYQENKGPSAARNIGLAKARGKYIQFLDADDLINSQKLIKQVDYLEKHNRFDLVYSDVLHFTTDLTVAKKHYSYSYQGDVLPYIVQLHYPAIHAALFKKSIIEKVGGFDDYSGGAEDWDLWLKLGLAKAYFGYLAGNFAYCRVSSRPNRRTGDMIGVYKSSLKVFQRYINIFNHEDKKRLHIKKTLCFLYLRLSVAALLKNDDLWKISLKEALKVPSWYICYLVSLFLFVMTAVLPAIIVRKLMKAILFCMPGIKLKNI